VRHRRRRRARSRGAGRGRRHHLVRPRHLAARARPRDAGRAGLPRRHHPRRRALSSGLTRWACDLIDVRVGRFVLVAVLIAAALPAHGATLAERRRELEQLTAQEDALAARLGADRNALARLLGALEMFSRDPPPLIVSPGDARDAVRAMILAKAIAPELEARAKTLRAEADQLAAVRRRAAQASGDL